MQDKLHEKSLIKQRILLYLDFKGVSKYEFYKISGVTRGVLDQNTGISEDNLARFIAYAKDIDLEWLLLGVGEITKSNFANYEIVKEPSTKYISPKDEVINKLTAECNEKANRIIDQMDLIAKLKDELSSLKSVDGAGSRSA